MPATLIGIVRNPHPRRKRKSPLDLSEEIYERYSVARCLKHNDGIVRGVPTLGSPSAAFLANISMTLQEWWKANAVLPD
jgi:hypothetical protein